MANRQLHIFLIDLGMTGGQQLAEVPEAKGLAQVDVRFASPQLEALAHGAGCPDGLAPLVIKEVQMVVFWLEQAEEEQDLSAIRPSPNEGGVQSFDIAGTHRLQYVFEVGVITILDLWCM